MEMFLMALCVGVFGLAVSAIAFSAATRETPSADADERAKQPVVHLPLEAPRFFAVNPPRPKAPPRVPVEVLFPGHTLQRGRIQLGERPRHAQTLHRIAGIDDEKRGPGVRWPTRTRRAFEDDIKRARPLL